MAVVDPGFLRGGGVNRKGGTRTYYVGPEILRAPLDPPMTAISKHHLPLRNKQHVNFQK